MGVSARHKVSRLAALVLYVLASATVGFAHRPLANATPPELAQFALPDGTLPIVCGQNGAKEQGGGGHASGVPLCDACCLTAAPGLLSPPSASLRPQASATMIAWASWENLVQTFWNGPALGARGPPVA